MRKDSGQSAVSPIRGLSVHLRQESLRRSQNTWFCTALAQKPHAVSAPSLSPAASWALMPKVTLEVTCWRWQSPYQFHSQRTLYEHNLKPLLGLPWWSNG